MDTENLKKAKDLFDQSKKISGTIANHNKKLEGRNCDKYALKFGGDSRFSVFKANVFLDCHHGYSGDSNCSVLYRIDCNVAEKALNAVLNKNMEFILTEMGKHIESQAKGLVADAEKEIKSATEFLKSLKAAE